MIRAIAIAIVVVTSGRVVADFVDRPTGAVDPADSVAVAGRYQLALAWSKCDPPGARKPVVELRPIDSRLELDLGPARAGLPVVVVSGDAATLAGVSGDVDVVIRWGKRGAIAVAIALDSGCRGRGTARRVATGIAACDELAALARIEAGCSSVAASARLEEVAALDQVHAGWARATGKRRRAIEAACRQRVDAIRPALTDAACLAIPADDAPTMIDECRDLAARIAQLSQCRTLPAEVRTQLREMLGQIAVHAVHADADAVAMTRQICLRQDEVLRELAPRVGCQ